MTLLLAFDLDGTLIDSKKDIADSLNQALALHGFATLSESAIQSMVGRGAKQLVWDAIGRPPAENFEEVFQSFWDCYEANLLMNTKLYPGVAEFLEKFSPLPMAIVTNKPFLFSQKIIEGLGLSDYFRWIIGGDSLEVQKPDPGVFSTILQDMGKEVKGLMVGDSEVDILSGQAVGFSTCAVTYGFRSREELEEHHPNFIINAFSELSDLPFFTQILD